MRSDNRPISDASVIRSCILGLAVGDAVGVPVEFCRREELDAAPVTGMTGFGTYPFPAGTWSDDTSMTLCALDALTKPDFTWDTVMENFGRWYYRSEFTPTGKMFDIGGTCRFAIDAYFRYGADSTNCGKADEDCNGNGSLMRILPFVLYAPYDIGYTEKASCLTHAHRRSQMACGIYAMVLLRLIETREKESWRDALREAEKRYGGEAEWKHFAPLLSVDTRSRESISGSGYVVDTLEAALWSLVTTGDFRTCILTAVNLGQDTDTVAAVAGGLAGALYGEEGIPGEWLDTLLRKEYLIGLCEKAAKSWRR